MSRDERSGSTVSGESAHASATRDPRPQPPEKPLPGDCCGGGCIVCVLDAYEEAFADYVQRLAAWQRRHPGGDAAA